VKRYCCDCANGKRTIGCCCHVAAVIFYLAHGRYKSQLINPSDVLSELFEEDDTIPVIQEDSENDD